MWSVNDYALIKSNILSPNFHHFGRIDVFFSIVKLTGYPFFVWNGMVYKVFDNQLGYHSTGIAIDDVELY